MTLMMLVLVAVTVGITFPAWRIARRQGNDSPWMLGLALPAIVVWVAASASGYGAQSLSNVVEIFYLFAGGVGLAYGHLFLVSRTEARPGPTALVMMVTLVVALLSRTFMPMLPE